MSRNYKFHNPESENFVRFALVEWLAGPAENGTTPRERIRTVAGDGLTIGTDCIPIIIGTAPVGLLNNYVYCLFKLI